MGKLRSLDVICGKDQMTVRAEFDGPFNGIVSSKGTWGQDNCVYVRSHSGVTHSTFKVMYNECGTKPDLQGKYYENTIVIQYGTDIIEAMDEAKRLRCEWFEAYEKPATFRPAIPVADLDVVEMNFQVRFSRLKIVSQHLRKAVAFFNNYKHITRTPIHFILRTGRRY